MNSNDSFYGYYRQCQSSLNMRFLCKSECCI